MTLHVRRYHLFVLLAFIAPLGCHSINSDTPTPSETPELPTVLDGFRVESWYLPDDDLLGFVKIPSGIFEWVVTAPPTQALRMSDGPPLPLRALSTSGSFNQ
ncbi:MAG: hypothetical protein Ct9H300mP25_08520 [Acidobacteriota bacterium]|nr:MAG: hypothetical protein Ct9H300mP25_08520 [Acidobacteriota bacterium]